MYLTKQRRLLLTYLEQHPDESLSARKIAIELANQGISASSVYRNLSSLEEEGEMRKFGAGDTGESRYQYIGAETCRKSRHFSCLRCKGTFHIREETASQLLALLERDDDCVISKSQTILYGYCKNCR